MAEPGRSAIRVELLRETDFTEGLKKIDVPTLVMHGDDDPIVPIDTAGRVSAKPVPGAEPKVYAGAPHGMCATHAEQINADLLAFFRR